MADKQGAALIVQPEPLFTVRPRYAENLRLGDGRGVRANFRLIEKRKVKFKATNSAMSETIRSELLGEKGGESYTSFLITGLSYQFTEKIQLSQVFGDHTVAYAFGSSPIVLNITGVVTDDIDNDWFTKFIFLYKDYLRGTQLARNFELARLSMHNAIYDGAVISLSMSQDASNDTLVTFNMQFLVRAFEFFSAQEYQYGLLADSATLDANAADKANDAVSVSRLKLIAMGAAALSKGLKTEASDGVTAAVQNEINLSKDLTAGVTSKFASAANAALGKASDAVTGASSPPGDQLTFSSKEGFGADETNVVIQGNTARIDRISATTSGSKNDFNAKVKNFFDQNLNPDRAISFLTAKKFGDVQFSTQVGDKVSHFSVIGVYTNTIQSYDTRVETVGGFLNEIKKNFETLNSKLTNLPDPFAAVSDAIAKTRQTVDLAKNLVNTVKQTVGLLSRRIDIFANVNAELAALADSTRGLRGAVSSFSTNSSQRVYLTLQGSPTSAEAMPFLGNSALGITPEIAYALLSGTISSVENVNLPGSTSTSTREQTSINALTESSLVVDSPVSLYLPTYTSIDSNALVFK